MKKSVLHVMVILGLTLSLSACANPGTYNNMSPMTSYDFNYKINTQGINVVQVFDDGAHTFIQMPPNSRIPAIFVEIGSEWKFAEVESTGSYLKLPMTTNRLMLKIGNSVARIMYAGAKPRNSLIPNNFQGQYAFDRSGNSVAYTDMPDEYIGGGWGRDQNQATTLNKYSYSDRVRGDTTEWRTLPNQMPEHQIKFAHGTARVTGMTPKQFVNLANAYKNADRVEVVGFNDSSDKENLAQERANAVTAALAAAGVPRSIIKSRLARQPVLGSKNSSVIGVTLTGFDSKKYEPRQNDRSIYDRATAYVAQNVNSFTVDDVIKEMSTARITPAEAERKLAHLNANAERAEVVPNGKNFNVDDVALKGGQEANDLTRTSITSESSKVAEVDLSAEQKNINESWTIKNGEYLRATLDNWSRRADWNLVWEHEEDFRLDIDNSFNGDFSTVVTNLINSLPQKLQIHVELIPDNNPPLIYITRDGAQ